jgi:hypothetical protein
MQYGPRPHRGKRELLLSDHLFIVGEISQIGFKGAFQSWTKRLIYVLQYIQILNVSDIEITIIGRNATRVESPSALSAN